MSMLRNTDYRGKVTTINRDQYGALCKPSAISESARALMESAIRLIAFAVKAKKIPEKYDYISWDKKGRSSGDALHHEIYDVSDGKALLCCRSAAGSKYGVQTVSKDYYLISKHGRGVRVLEANKGLAAKAAKAAGNKLGAAINVLLGKDTYSPPANRVRSGYKLVQKGESGDFISVWDKSTWTIGKTRIEAATHDHRGGFYYYAEIDEAISAAASKEVFGDAREHDHLVLLEVEASGRHFKNGKKLCASRIKPLREVAMTR